MWEVASGHTDGTTFHFTGLGTLDQSLRAWDDLLPFKGQSRDTSARWLRIVFLDLGKRRLKRLSSIPKVHS